MGALPEANRRHRRYDDGFLRLDRTMVFAEAAAAAAVFGGKRGGHRVFRDLFEFQRVIGANLVVIWTL